MAGIIVGIDGSDHSRHALDWAIREAAVRHAPLTVLTVQQPLIGYWGNPVLYPDDEGLAEKARKMAQEETDSVLGKFGAECRPSSVTVQAVAGLPAEALLEAAADADLLVVGSRGAADSSGCLWARSASRSPTTPTVLSWSSPPRTSDTRVNWRRGTGPTPQHIQLKAAATRRGGGDNHRRPVRYLTR